MSGMLFGGNMPMGSVKPALGALQVQQSSYGVTIPLVYGQTRIPANLLWYADFVATPHSENVGGKGGSTTTSSYTYQAAVLMGLCEGVVSAIPRVWSGKSILTGAIPTTTLTSHNEPFTVPIPPYQVTVAHAATFVADVLVMTSPDGFSNLEKVTGAPGPLQYSVAAGVYTFNASQSLAQVYISYTYTTGGGTTTAIAQTNMALFTGTNPQTAWGYATTSHPTQALGYQGLAYVAGAAVDLDAGGTLPAFNFEVAALKQYGGSIVDANPKEVVTDLLTTGFYGAGWLTSRLGDYTQFSNYCVASGIFISPAYTSQATAASMVLDILDVANCAAVYSEGVLKIIPYGDVAATGNSVTYTPVLTVRYDLNDSDFIGAGEDPVVCHRGNPVDAFNSVSVEFRNRLNAYNPEPVEAFDAANTANFGIRQQPIIQRHMICDLAVARGHAQRKLQRGLYIRNTYSFKLGWRYFLLEPMDIVTLTDSNLGLSLAPVRILSIEEDVDGLLTVTAEEFPGQVSHNGTYPAQAVDGYGVDYNSAPGNTNAPEFYVPPIELTENAQVAWMLATGGTNWGGCDVWTSTDNATYKKIGRVDQRMRTGLLTALLPLYTDPDTINTLSVNLTESHGQLVSGTQSDADKDHTLCYVGGELISYRTATLTAAYNYDLTYLRRGQYNSPISAHSIGAKFVRLDGTQFSIPFSAGQIGQTLYIKLPAFNLYGGGLQNLADVSPTTFTLIAPPLPSNAQPLHAAIGLSAPTSVKVYASPDAAGVVKTVKVQFDIAIENNVVPDGFALMVSMDKYPVQLPIDVDSGTSLTILGVAQATGTYTTLSGTTASYLKVADATNPLDLTINLAGHFWAQVGTSQWRKVTSYDLYGFYFNEPFDITPTPSGGQAANWAEVAWADERPAEYRLGAIVAGGNTEIVKWTQVSQSGDVFSILGLTRAQEGTTQTSGSGGTFNYYPAPGVGTQIFLFPASSVVKNADGSYTGTTNVDVTIPAGYSIAMTAAVWRDTTAGLLRSPIVPALYGGPL